MGNISEDIKSEFKTAHSKAYINILFTANWITTQQNLFFKPFGLSPQQYNILRILRGSNTEITVQTVKNRMIDRAPNVTRLMDKLCAKSFMERLDCKTDRRIVHVKITEKGLNLLAEIDTTITKNMLSNLTKIEAEHLSNLLDKIR